MHKPSAASPKPKVLRHFLTVLLLSGSPLLALAQSDDQAAARMRLGEQLFGDLLFTNPATDYSASCAGCHAVGERVANRTPRAYADYVPQSLMANKEQTLRNTPTLLDLAKMQAFNHDGSFTSLESLIESKLLGPELGWKPTDGERAKDAIHYVLLNEGVTDRSNHTYVDQFKAAYGIDLESQSREQALAHGVQALADFVRSLETTQTASWDAFVAMNRLRPGPISNEDAKSYAGEILYSRISNQEGRLLVKRPEGFTQEAYRGFKIFFRDVGDSAGNCVVCHTPPAFTDFRFHNTGIAEVDYDRVHGADAFKRLEIPQAAKAERPVEGLSARPAAGEPGKADLGHWNYVDPAASPERRSGESEEDFLARMAGAFKTPTLRNLQRTDPYMHNGAYAAIRDAVAEKVRINQLARAGKLRSIDEEYLVMNLSEDDIEPLTVFLGLLDEVGKSGFREFLINLAED